ncbi:hypothetical protein LWF15_12175 [Kineosporia rhizophila]|uniref:glycoside hydrolase family 26 protein n=1 Tax=Kineosporia rhizophila TaxID=84633 RepID=UPI001E4582A6|nr:glycosyl hydrolase [Kineosporia rhizophila]MCE0536265.1 hypothetical protein [Kineosporia rhizophila]
MVVVALIAVLTLVGGLTYAVGFRGDDPPSVTTSPSLVDENPAEDGPGLAPGPDEKKPQPVPTSGAAEKVKIGVFRGTHPDQVGEFEDWLGRDVPYAVDYSNRDYWDDVADPGYMLRAWQDTGYRMVYGVVMLPARDRTVTLAVGAAGDYDHHFRRLARNLVAHGQGDAIIRLAWEFNVSKMRWELTPEDQTDFVTYWRRIVTTMRSVPGAEKLRFDWNVNNGGETYDSTIFWPGDKYVDYVGVDVYDISWAEDTYPYPADCTGSCRRDHQVAAWANIENATYGLNFWSSFARERGKPLSMPEWGLWDRSDVDGRGGADNPYFVQRMYEFIDDPRNNVAYQAYFDVNPEDRGRHQLSGMPRSESRFRELFGR